MAIIALEGMHFFAHHGVFEAERMQGNDFQVDVWLDTGSMLLPTSDQLEDAIDYGHIYTVVQASMARPRNLLETLVLEIGQRLQEIFPQLASIRVRVCKSNPPVAGPCLRSVVEQTFVL